MKSEILNENVMAAVGVKVNRMWVVAWGSVGHICELVSSIEVTLPRYSL
jgi:hypothetical protein